MGFLKHSSKFCQWDSNLCSSQICWVAGACKRCWPDIPVTYLQRSSGSGISCLGLSHQFLQSRLGLTAPRGEDSPFRVLTRLLAPQFRWQWKGWLSWWTVLLIELGNDVFALHSSGHIWRLQMNDCIERLNANGSFECEEMRLVWKELFHPVLQGCFYRLGWGGNLGVSPYGPIGLCEVQRHHSDYRKQQNTQTHGLRKTMSIQKMFYNSHLPFCPFLTGCTLCFIDPS